MLPISLASAVIGTDTETGSAVSGARGSDAGVAAGAAVGAATDDGAWATGAAASATAAAAALCTVWSVVCGLEGAGAAPAGTKLVTTPAASTSPHVTIPKDAIWFRLNVLLLLWRENTPALKPARVDIPDGTGKPSSSCEQPEQLRLH